MSKNIIKYSFIVGVSATVLSAFVGSKAKNRPTYKTQFEEPQTKTLVDDTTKKKKKNKYASEDGKLKYPYKDESVNDPLNYPNEGGLKLKDPSNIEKKVEYDPDSGNYVITQKMGSMDYRPPTYMDTKEYMDYKLSQQVKDYWRQRTHAEAQNQSNRAIIPKLRVNGELFDRIFGGNTVDIRPQGTADLIFSLNRTKTDNPTLPVKQRKITTFDFNERIQLNVVGKIGDKLKLTTNYNTEATFDFENQMKLEYAGHEDEIIKKIEAGNVQLPLTGSLITGSQTLFGIKTQLQFGRLTATTVLSQQKGKKQEVEVTGGAQISKYEINADNYEANRHFFLGHYFRDRYDSALSKLPVVQSGINITKIEVWVTNRNASVTDTRNIVAFSDLAEDSSSVSSFTKPFIVDNIDIIPTNDQNDLYKQVADTMTGYLKDRVFSSVTSNLPGWFQLSRDYERIESARKLSATEFKVNSKLGFVSINQTLNYDDVLAVAYQYTLDGKTYQVGEFSTDGIIGQKPLYLKLLKGINANTKLPIWDLMMKNVYSIGGYQINPQDFRLDIVYNNPSTGTDINYIPEGTINGTPLIRVMGVDRVNTQTDALSDGVFDFLDGITIDAPTGRVFFPVTEPFGKHLYNKLVTTPTLATKYAFPQLYDSTKTKAQQFPEKNRFKLRGSYKSSSSSEISLNTVNVPQGSVTVTAGGIKLTENIDYTVDYTLGRVKIINEGVLNSGTPIKVSLESNSLFAIQSKSLIGTRLDYRFNKDANIGSTIMRLTERPLTQKVNIGDEPISNTVIGLDGNYLTEAPFLTRALDKLPLFSTKQMSSIDASGEVAKLFPGHPKSIGKNGNAYIDDFEGSISRIDIKSPQAWFLASVPEGQPELFPEAELIDSLAYNFNRAKIAWYYIDPLFLRQTNGLTPGHLTKVDMSNHFTREIVETELFPKKELPNGQPNYLPTLDLAYYPTERGPYNFDVGGVTGLSAGIDATGKLNAPTSRWAGIMRRIETNDFEASNIEYIQFWVMDPFNSDNTDPNTRGDLYVNIGNVSEDILKDNKKSFENGLPIDGSNSTAVAYETTKWGHVPSISSIVNAFDVNESARPFQDVGYDGLSDVEEQTFFNTSYLQKIAALYGTASNAYKNAEKDPAGDDYHFYRGSNDYDANAVSVLNRYKKYNNSDGNSPTSGQPNHDGFTESYTTSATTTPNTEDINRDNTLNSTEGYYQYKVSLKAADLTTVGKNYITDIYNTNAQVVKDGSTKSIKWIQIKIPIKSFESKVGNIEDFRAIRFIRLFFKGADKPVVLRFARMEFIRGEWRPYEFSLISPGEYITNNNTVPFTVSAVNYEENGKRSPVNYVLPPGIQRQINNGSSNLARLNEQAMALTVCGLEDGDSRAAFRNFNMDVRMYKRIKLYVHCEATSTTDALKDGDVNMFMRLGTDYTSNYYEYELPLKVTPPGSYTGDAESDQYKVWPADNEIDLLFSKLQAAKQLRNNDLAKGTASLTTPYTVTDDGGRKITIVGTPNLATVKNIMVGIRNPKQQLGDASDDGQAKCAEVWVNELRLSEFDENGGWAALGRVNTKLADLGTLSMAGNISTPGWGSIEKKVQERQRSTNYGYDISTNIELGKFSPAALNIKVPVYVGYSESFIVPRFNPLDPDINLREVLSNPSIPKTQRDSLKKITVDYTRRRSINFTNVKKEKGKNSKSSHIYDLENLALSYSFNEIFHRDVTIEYNTTRTYKAGLVWGFSPKAKGWKPFEKMKGLNPKYFSLIKDLNFTPVPSRLGFTTDINRMYNESKNRNTSGLSDVIIIPYFNKTFTMNRNYDLKWDLTKGLKLDFNATNEGRILEPQGRIDTKEKRDSVKQSILGLGTTTRYRHTVNVNYTIPINKLPFMEFATASVRYSANYEWQRAPFAADSMGNTIQNSNQWQWTGQFNLTTLYNKIPYLKKLAARPLDQKKKDRDKQKKEEEAAAKKSSCG